VHFVAAAAARAAAAAARAARSFDLPAVIEAAMQAEEGPMFGMRCGVALGAAT
jgi:hypothetical protein